MRRFLARISTEKSSCLSQYGSRPLLFCFHGVGSRRPPFRLVHVSQSNGNGPLCEVSDPAVIGGRNGHIRRHASGVCTVVTYLNTLFLPCFLSLSFSTPSTHGGHIAAMEFVSRVARMMLLKRGIRYGFGVICQWLASPLSWGPCLLRVMRVLWYSRPT
jgi:hypothetical protein